LVDFGREGLGLSVREGDQCQARQKNDGQREAPVWFMEFPNHTYPFFDSALV
jgi:hypothetical protein